MARSQAVWLARSVLFQIESRGLTHPGIANCKLYLRDQKVRLCYGVKAKERSPFA
jgi:hypothetical protein